MQETQTVGRRLKPWVGALQERKIEHVNILILHARTPIARFFVVQVGKGLARVGFERLLQHRRQTRQRHVARLPVCA